MGLEKQGSKPTGFIGKIFGIMMNRYHTPIYVNYFKNNLPEKNSNILDIGCGGGKFIRFLSNINDSYLLYGIDHSQEMVELSKKTNCKGIEKKQVEIKECSVTSIPFEDSKIDLITAFETVQFWPDIDKSFSEIFRLLDIGGSFLIINRYPPEGSKWWEMAKIKNEEEFITKLRKAGFIKVSVDLNFKKKWIIVNAKK